MEHNQIRSPFSVNPSDVTDYLQMEIIELQCYTDFSDTFVTEGLNKFHQYLGCSIILAMFGST